MRKYVLFILLIIEVLVILFMVSARRVDSNIKKNFENSGYVLKYEDASEKYFFEENASYKELYNNQITFKNTDGDKIILDKDNFAHYSNGSISSFSKGVLVDLNEIDQDPITYYNLSANKTLKKLANGKYYTKHLNSDIEFTNLIWKISANKYLVAGNNMQIVFADKTTKDIQDYLEIEYKDNEIVKIYNNEVRYETISSDVYLQINDDTKLNLGNKCIYKDNKVKMSLENMVIDSNDNVNIIDLEEYEEEILAGNVETNTEVNGNKAENSNGSAVGGSATANSGGTVNANGGTSVVVGNNNGDNLSNNGQTTIVEEVVENGMSVKAPKYKVTEFKVTSTGLKAIVEIEDEEARLITGTTTEILNNVTGKAVYTMPSTGETVIKIDTSSLSPDTEYTLAMQATYAIERNEYKKYFVYKVFRTPTLGVTLKKDLFTTNSLSFDLQFDKDSEITKLDVELVEAEQIKEGIVNVNGSIEKIQFYDLNEDTDYTLKIKNIFIGNTTNNNSYEYVFKTLKSKPKAHTNMNVEIDKRNSMFVLSVPGLEDVELDSLRYEIYTQTEGKETKVYTKTTLEDSLKLKVDDNTIKRNKEYYCKVYATYYDNEKVVEYEVANTSSSFIMNSSKMPTIRFEEDPDDGITFNSIKGNIIIEDEGNTISVGDTKIEISYASTTGGINDKGSIKYNGINSNKELPIELKELKSNETYNISVNATYDLHDGNDERYGFIGNVMITTEEPIPMRAVWTEGTEGIDMNLRLRSTADSDLEAESLYSFNLSLYLGQEGVSSNPIATKKLVDNGTTTFSGSLKSSYYDVQGLITNETFGISNDQMLDIQRENRYCTIVIDKAYDYVSKNENKNFENELPIESNVKTFEIQDLLDINPSDSLNAINMEEIPKRRLATVSYNKIIETRDYSTISEITNNGNISADTIAAISLQANLSELQLEKFKYFEYFVYDSAGNMVATSGLMAKNTEYNRVPIALFLISNGTPRGTVDNAIARGNEYNYRYYAYEDIDRNGKYPSDEKGEDYWEIYTKPSVDLIKQQPYFIMYPSVSDEDGIAYKYKISDVDKAIEIEDGKKYFHNFYADIEGTKKEISEASGEVDANGFRTVKFDGLSEKDKNYNLEIRILQARRKRFSATYRKLVIQKVEDIIENINPNINISEKAGISSTITINDLSATEKQKIAKVQVELKDKDIVNPIPTLIIEKSVGELTKSNWKILINYLELIKSTNANLKNKSFDVNLKFYYINNVIGYDSIDNYVAYQTEDGEWLKCNESQEFTIVTSSSTNNDSSFIYENHTYNFSTNEKVNIYENEVLKSYLNYSEKGLVRNIGGANTAIIPKKVQIYNINSVEEIQFNNIVPGIDSDKDLETIAYPAKVTVNLNKILTKDTILDGLNVDEYKIYIEIYNSVNNEIKEVAEIRDNTVTIDELENGKEYYYKLYVKINNSEVKYYLYDIVKNTNNVQYTFYTLREVVIIGLTAGFGKTSEQEGIINIVHSASVDGGFKGFRYEILDNDNNLITQEIEYSVDKDNFNSTSTGRFDIDLEDFNGENAEFGKVYIKANRGTFFEYNIKYKVKVTPIIEEEGEIHSIGDTVEKEFIHNPMKPEMAITVRRKKAVDDNNSYIRWNIGISDDDYLIVGREFYYRIYKDGTEIIFETVNGLKSYNTIEMSKETLGDIFDIESEYEIRVCYKYYKSNIYDDDEHQETITKKKSLAPIINGISIGAVSWEIENGKDIKMKFYNSYGLESVKSLEFSITDTAGNLVKPTTTVPNVLIDDQTLNENDSHKSITFDSEYEFETSKSYLIRVDFMDEHGNTLTSFEPENPVTIN